MPATTTIASQQQAVEQPAPATESCTFICSRDTLDGAYPALMLAINARRQGMEATVFYTFMGINVVRKDRAEKCRFVPQGVMGAIPGMSPFATVMMKKKIEGAGVPALGDMLDMAQMEGVKLVACKMTMDMMGFTAEDMIDGVEIQTAEDYLKHARHCKINMFT